MLRAGVCRCLKKMTVRVGKSVLANESYAVIAVIVLTRVRWRKKLYTPQAVIALNVYYKYAKPERRMTEKIIVFHKSWSLKS